MTETGFLRRENFARLLEALRQAGYRCLGPQVRDAAIVYDTLVSVDDLPSGVRDDQAPGTYRLVPAGGPRRFAWANGPQALKRLTFTPSEVLWRARRAADGRLTFEQATAPAEMLAVIGARACDLAALDLQDRHFLEGPFPDANFRARRERLFLVVVHCTHPAATCFCASTGDGPRAVSGFDLALSELDDGFIVESASARGEAIASRLPLEPVSPAQSARAERELFEAGKCQQRSLPSRNLRDALFTRLDHPRWEEVAGRCLACGNCTSVCPTCFCHAEGEHPGLDGASTAHAREWDSCFTAGHSYIHGFTVRADRRARYRQWLTHKLGSWHEQYGRSGCVGCGRCIAWCPVGIDITEEATAICGAAHG